MQKYLYPLVGAVICVLLLSACGSDPRSPWGFRLPDGDADKGQVLFVELQCNTCHTIAGLEIDAPAEAGPVAVVLGGPVARVKTYGDLVSSIINPSHKLIRSYPKDEISDDGESLMVVYNETMTVQQLIDLVAFLQQQYKVAAPQYSYYAYKY
jgi:sulfur-oxidizing protein SoxX